MTVDGESEGPPDPEPTELVPDARVVSGLLEEQAPHLAHLPVRASPAEGSSNWVFRLGDALAVRLPRSDSYVPDLLAELRWLPHLACGGDTPIPRVVVHGAPSTGFPRPWAVLSWVPGEMPLDLDESQQARLARGLGTFLRGLHSLDTTGAREGTEHRGYRCGEPVTDEIDDWADRAATALADLFDPAGVREAWSRLRRVPLTTSPACWVHTDLSAENLLVRPDGRLAGVIDFGGVGIGDPAVDLLYAWGLFDAPARDVLRIVSGADDATWARARAWAFVGPGLVTIDGYRHSMPARTRRLTSMVETVAAEVGVRLR